jgi:hypothetical protein
VGCELRGYDLVRQRKDAFRSYQALTPPRVLTSDGEAVAGSYRRDDFPEGALVGLAVSAGTVEGRAVARPARHLDHRPPEPRAGQEAPRRLVPPARLLNSPNLTP